jgi:hypothetical protein
MSAMVCRRVANAAKSTGIVFFVRPLENGSGCIKPLTEPKSNADQGLKSNGLRIFIGSQNLLDFASDKK